MACMLKKCFFPFFLKEKSFFLYGYITSPLGTTDSSSLRALKLAFSGWFCRRSSQFATTWDNLLWTTLYVPGANYVHVSIHFCLLVCTKILTLSVTWRIYSGSKQGGPGCQLVVIFPQCPHFTRLTDNHPKCQSCIFGVGKTGCSCNNTCDFCAAWTDDMWDIEEESRERSAKRRKSRSKKKASVSSIVEMLGGALPSAHDVESTTVSSQPLSPAHSHSSGMSGREHSPGERSFDSRTGIKRARSPESPRHGPDRSGECRAKVGLSDERRHSPRPSPSGLESSHRDCLPLGQTNGCHEAGMQRTCSPRARDMGGSPPAESPLDYDDSGLRIPYHMLPMLNGPRVFLARMVPIQMRVRMTCPLVIPIRKDRQLWLEHLHGTCSHFLLEGLPRKLWLMERPEMMPIRNVPCHLLGLRTASPTMTGQDRMKSAL